MLSCNDRNPTPRSAKPVTVSTRWRSERTSLVHELEREIRRTPEADGWGLEIIDGQATAQP